MSILINESYANPNVPLWASSSGGSGGGPYIPETVVVIPAPSQLSNSTEVPNGDQAEVFSLPMTDTPRGLYLMSLDIYLSQSEFDNPPNGYLSFYLTYSEDGDTKFNTILYSLVNTAITLPYVSFKAMIPMENAANLGLVQVSMTNLSGATLTFYNYTNQNYSLILMTNQFTVIPP